LRSRLRGAAHGWFVHHSAENTDDRAHRAALGRARVGEADERGERLEHARKHNRAACRRPAARAVATARPFGAIQRRGRAALQHATMCCNASASCGGLLQYTCGDCLWLLPSLSLAVLSR
jgi:hypothetical protein